MRVLACIVLAVAFACDRAPSPARLRSASDSPSSVARISDSVRIVNWYSGKRVDHLVISADTSFVAVAVEEHSANPGRRTQIDLWARTNLTAPDSRSDASEGEWIDTMVVVRSTDGAPLILAIASNADGNSFVEFVVRGNRLDARPLDPPNSDESLSPARFEIRYAGGIACAVRIEWARDQQPNRLVLYKIMGSALIHGNERTACPPSP